MSNEIFPTLPGLTWSVTKEPEFNTKVQTSVNMTELRASFSATPVYTYSLTYDVLRDDTLNDELRELGGFFMARYGRFDSWLFTDPTDNAVTDQVFGTGNGSVTTFQLERSFGDFSEKVSNVNAISEITVANVPTANYTVSSTGLVTFAAAPGANEVVRWTGTYYFRCRFREDGQEFENFMYQLWNTQSLQFRANLGTKLL
jgi:uncharacterized protein (TIGR02217 family)